MIEAHAARPATPAADARPPTTIERVGDWPTPLIAALLVAQREARPLAKDSRNDHHGYRFTSAAAAAGEAKRALNLAELVLLREGLSIEPWPQARPSYVTRDGKVAEAPELAVRIRYRLAHAPSGAQVELEAIGPVIPEAGRHSDKALNAAITNVGKYVLRDLLLLEWVEAEADDRQDPDQRERPDRQARQKEERRRPADSGSKAPQPDPERRARLERLAMAIKEFGRTEARELLGLEDLDELKRSSAEAQGKALGQLEQAIADRELAEKAAREAAREADRPAERAEGSEADAAADARTERLQRISAAIKRLGRERAAGVVGLEDLNQLKREGADVQTQALELLEAAVAGLESADTELLEQAKRAMEARQEAGRLYEERAKRAVEKRKVPPASKPGGDVELVAATLALRARPLKHEHDALKQAITTALGPAGAYEHPLTAIDPERLEETGEAREACEDRLARWLTLAADGDRLWRRGVDVYTDGPPVDGRSQVIAVVLHLTDAALRAARGAAA